MSKVVVVIQKGRLCQKQKSAFSMRFRQSFPREKKSETGTQGHGPSQKTMIFQATCPEKLLFKVKNRRGLSKTQDRKN